MGSSTRKEKVARPWDKNQGIDGADGVEAGNAAGEGGAAQGGGDAPEERGGGDVEVAAERFAGCRATCRLQQKLAELCSAGRAGAPAPTWAVALPSVVGSGFGVDQDAEQFGKFLFEADFQFGRDVVHAG